MKPRTNAIRCPNCKSALGYVRRRDKTWVCRQCLVVTPLAKGTKKAA